MIGVKERILCFDTLPNVKAKEAVVALAALAHETRLGVFRLLVQQGEGGLAAGEIAAGLNVLPATLTFHLKGLAQAGLVKSQQDGCFIYHAADFAAMNRLVADLTENCCGDGVACGPPTTRRAALRAARAQIGA